MKFDEDALLARMPLVLDWLGSLGIAGRSSRYGRYKKIISDFHSQYETTQDVDDAVFKELCSAYQECLDIAMVHHRFADVRGEKFLSNLARVVTGSPTPELRDAGPSRDYLFEMLVATIFTAAGYEVDFSSHHLTDVVARRSGNLVRIECKRLSSVKKLGVRMAEAAQQLRNSREGIIAVPSGFCFIDVSSCVLDDVGRKAETIEAAGRAVRNSIGRFITRHYKTTIIEQLNDAIDVSYGTAFYARLPFIVKDEESQEELMSSHMAMIFRIPNVWDESMTEHAKGLTQGLDTAYATFGESFEK